MKEDQRYYVQCPIRKNKARIPILRCFDCEFVTGYINRQDVTNPAEIGCGFPKVSRPDLASKRRKRRRR